MANSYTTRLKKRLPAVGDVNWDDEWHDNEKIDEVVAGALLSVNRIVSGGAVAAGTGLVVDYAALDVWLLGARASIVAGSLTMTAAQVGQQLANWVYVNDAGTVTVSTTPPSGDYIPLAQVDVSDTAIVRIADLRPMIAAGTDADLLDGQEGSYYAVQATVQAALDLKADLASPALTGNPTAPTQAITNNSTNVATTAYVKSLFSGGDGHGFGYRYINGTLVQAVTATFSTSTPSITFPVAFPNVVTCVVFAVADLDPGDLRINTFASDLTKVGFVRTSTLAIRINIIAWGY